MTVLEAFSELNDSMECFVERAGRNQQVNKATGLDPPDQDPPTYRGPPAPSAHLRSAPKIPPWSIPHFFLQEGPAPSRTITRRPQGRALPSAPAWSAPCRAPSRSRSGCPGRRRSPCPACSAASPGWLFPAPSAASPAPEFPVEREAVRPHHQQHLARPRSCRRAQDRSKS